MEYFPCSFVHEISPGKAALSQELVCKLLNLKGLQVKFSCCKVLLPYKSMFLFQTFHTHVFHVFALIYISMKMTCMHSYLCLNLAVEFSNFEGTFVHFGGNFFFCIDKALLVTKATLQNCTFIRPMIDSHGTTLWVSEAFFGYGFD